MVLELYNTLTRDTTKVEPEAPGGEIRLYTCGPTVYNRVHIGNLRAFLFYDVLRRTLEWKGFRVKHVMNVTDVDDKTIRGAHTAGEKLRDFTDRYLKLFLADLDALGIRRPTVMPRATDPEALAAQVKLVERLIEKGFAYKAPDGSVYFKIEAFPEYGKLAHLDKAGLKAGGGGRVEDDEYEKESWADFALWKAWTEKDGDVSWETSLGRGRPGWHLECSALAMSHLGETIDIHAGGVDLVFPHHENEIAQSEAATGKPFARVWAHNEHLLIAGAKMSKSKHNFYTLDDLAALARATPREVRYALLSVNYRKQLNFQVTYDSEGKPMRFDSILDARRALERLDNFRRSLRDGCMKKGSGLPVPVTERQEALLANTRKAFERRLDDDLNVSGALGELFLFVNDVNKEAYGAEFGSRAEKLLRDLDSVLGIFVDHEVGGKGKLRPDEEALLKERAEVRREAQAAKARGDKAAMKAAFLRSDELREKLKTLGFELEDRPDGTTGWKRARA
ncbi:cysteine--tRNA ligase [bacterium]|nr:cysteine--tRNA ligase [bacterium]